MSDTGKNATMESSVKLEANVKLIEPTKNLVAFASIKIADCFVVKNLKVVSGEKGIYVDMPSQKNNKGDYYDTCFPTTPEFREQIKATVLEAYDKAIDKVQALGAAQSEVGKKHSIKAKLHDGAAKAAAQKSNDAPVKAMPKRDGTAL